MIPSSVRIFVCSEPVDMRRFGALFKIERSLADAPRKKKERLRAKHSQPIVEAFFSWCDAEWPELLKDTPLYDGVRYARNQRQGLSRFLLASCRMLDIEPWSYLRDVLCLLPDWPRHRLLELSPAGWAKTAAGDDVKKWLDANPYRALTLGRE